MPEFKDYTGQKINNWLVLEHRGFNKHGESLWYVKCDCDNDYYEVRKLSGINRNIRHCKHCTQKIKLEKEKTERIGLQFGKLTIVDYYGYREDSKSKAPFWVAKCECGSNKDIIATFYDIKKKIKSCGCSYKSEEFLNRMKEIGSARKKYNEFVELEDGIEVICSNGSFYIDREDKNMLMELDVCFYIKDGYAYCKSKSLGEIQVHRIIMGVGKFDRKTQIIVDHEDGKKNNNRKSNLRITHKKNNPINCNMYSNNTSGVKGVSWLERLGKWQVNIQIDKKNKYLGVYEDLEEAKMVRVEAEKKYFGEFRREIEYDI